MLFNTRRRNALKQSYLGFSIVELIIALAIGTFLAIATVGLFGAGKSAAVSGVQFSQINNNAQFAFSIMDKVMRYAGHRAPILPIYYGCIDGNTQNGNIVIPSSGDVYSPDTIANWAAMLGLRMAMHGSPGQGTEGVGSVITDTSTSPTSYYLPTAAGLHLDYNTGAYTCNGNSFTVPWGSPSGATYLLVGSNFPDFDEASGAYTNLLPPISAIYNGCAGIGTCSTTSDSLTVIYQGYDILNYSVQDETGSASNVGSTTAGGSGGQTFTDYLNPIVDCTGAVVPPYVIVKNIFYVNTSNQLICQVTRYTINDIQSSSWATVQTMPGTVTVATPTSVVLINQGVELMRVLLAQDTDEDGSVNGYITPPTSLSTTVKNINYARVVGAMVGLILDTNTGTTDSQSSTVTLFGTSYPSTSTTYRRAYRTTLMSQECLPIHSNRCGGIDVLALAYNYNTSNAKTAATNWENHRSSFQLAPGQFRQFPFSNIEDTITSACSYSTQANQSCYNTGLTLDNSQGAPPPGAQPLSIGGCYMDSSGNLYAYFQYVTSYVRNASGNTVTYGDGSQPSIVSSGGGQKVLCKFRAAISNSTTGYGIQERFIYDTGAVR